ncbi:sigma-70 family RNA polymerase sigma factor [Paludisphaera rhizosphaerae]|uniref:sigma-70 family RNA polymerase sigma factor n=1 Tax=Paludisphaera rhizosphaerae TaxID=2711216 RepID=UPI0013EB6063|nr:sigma-70 family RNA polymerase sigma factor [Paludisphaera rhizosphaerae]
MNAAIDERTTDEELWRRVCAGDRNAFERVVLRHQGIVAGVAYNACGDLAASEDLAQETFWAAWRSRESLEDPSRLRPWLCGIARNLAANAARRSNLGKNAATIEGDDLEGHDPNPADAALQREESAVIWGSLRDLPDLYREPLILYYRQDQSVADVAEALDLSEDAVKQRLARGRAMLRDRLADLVEDGLRRSKPGKTFTTGVMAGLGLTMGTKTATAATGAIVPAMATPGLIGGLAGGFLGMAGGWLGTWLPAQAAQSIAEREILLGFGRRLIVASLLFMAAIVGSVWLLAGGRYYLPTWLTLMVAFQAYIFWECWRMARRLREARASAVLPRDANRTAVRRGLGGLSRKFEGRVYRSSFTLLGLPLIDVQVGDPPVLDSDGIEIVPTTAPRRAMGWIAVGDEAVGVLLAVGGKALGGIAVGGLAVGIVSLGGVAVGVVGLGGLAVGLLAIGGAAIGGIAVGGVAIGWFAAGGAAIAWQFAFGGFAMAWELAVGGGVIAPRTIPHAEFPRWLAGQTGISGVIVRGLAQAVEHVGKSGPIAALIAVGLSALQTAVMYRRRSTAKGAMGFLVMAALTSSLAGCSSPVQATEPSRFQLGNGLRVMIRPVAGTSTVAVVTLFDVGGDHDPAGRSGLAHLVEHLYVTAKAGDIAARTADAFFRRYPAGCNAQTGDRYTAIASVVPAGELDAELREAAARMGSLEITDADLDRERPRLLDEVGAMFERVPTLAAMNNAREIVRPTPRGGRRGGLPAHVERLTAEDVREHWRRYYKPRNAILCLAGAVDPETARPAIERSFGAITAGEAPPPPGDPVQSPEVREKAVESITPAPVVTEAAAAPQPRDASYPAYLVLGVRLTKAGMDRSSGAQVYMPLLDDPAVLAVTTTARAGESPEEVRRRLDAWLSRTVETEPTADEIAGIAPFFGFFLETSELPDQALGGNLYGTAFAMGRREQLGVDPARMRKAVEAVSVDDVRRAAVAIFGPPRRGVALLSSRK